MNLDEIRGLTEFMEEKDLVEVEYEKDGVRIKLRRAEPQNSAAPAMALASAPAVPPVAAGPAIVEFRSPLVGTFYVAPRPDAEPFVQVGDEVGPDRVLCIVEAMKVMNEIKAEMKGRIREIVPKNGQAVQFGEVLFRIEPVQG